MYHDCPRTHPAPHVTDRVYIGRGGVEPLLCSRCLIAWEAKPPLLVPSENDYAPLTNISQELFEKAKRLLRCNP